jgi:putative CocE/NonD family hydrolase
MNTFAVEWHIATPIPLRDGVRLNATVYLPKHRPEPSPCICTLTPYMADSNHEQAMYFASNGLPFIVVDARGRGNSEGVFRPFIQEANDGYDMVEWVARQPFCNGQVAMWGGSYCGYNQWATAKELPPHLATIVPTAAPYLGVDFPMRNNIFYPYGVQWLTLTQGRTSQAKICSDRKLWAALYRQWHESGRPFVNLSEMCGRPHELFREWLQHPEPDAYWDTHNPTAEQYGRMAMPILTITGCYDDDQPGALAHYREHMHNATAASRERHYLVIGPWDHQGTGTPSAEFGGLRFADASLVDLTRLRHDWYLWTMDDGPKPSFLKEQVAYYVMAAEVWRYADALESVTAGYDTLFLESRGSANDVFVSGSLSELPGRGPPDSYTYDPADVSGPEVDAEAQTVGGSLVDQTVIFASRNKQLIYHTAPFERDIEISGAFKLTAWISINTPDTDIYAAVYEIGLDGGSVRLSTDAVRARYREGLRTPKLIHTSEALRYDFQRFTFVSRQVRRGYRLRLVISPIGRLVESTFAEKNYNRGGIVAEEAATSARPVTLQLFHDQTHTSALYVPRGRV